VFIQSFEIANLKALDDMTEVPLIQLLWKEGKPFDVHAAGGETTYDAMATAAGLQAIAAYADGVGPEKNHFVIPLDASGRLDPARATRLVADAHAAGLVVHPYTFRAENHFLPAQYRGPGPATASGDGTSEIEAFLAAGIDGFFTDNPDVGAAACRATMRRRG
jgi:glycerophosphoryl diester phosphodiesterase